MHTYYSFKALAISHQVCLLKLTRVVLVEDQRILSLKTPLIICQNPWEVCYEGLIKDDVLAWLVGAALF